MKIQEEKDLVNIKKKLQEFRIIDKLLYMVYITEYISTRKIDSDLTITRKSNIGSFEKLKLLFNQK